MNENLLPGKPIAVFFLFPKREDIVDLMRTFGTKIRTKRIDSLFYVCL